MEQTLKSILWRALPVFLLLVFVTAAKAQTTDTPEQTFTLTNSSSQNDADALVTLRNMLDPHAKVSAGPAAHTIVVHGTADQMLLAHKIVDDLNRAHPGARKQSASTVFMTEKTMARPLDMENFAEQTFYLANNSEQENNAVTMAVRKQIEPHTKIYLVAGQHAVVTRTTADQLPQVGKLLHDLDAPQAPRQESALFDAHTSRPALDTLAEQTFYLGHDPALGTYGTGVATALRNMVDGRSKVYLAESLNAIVMISTPDQLALAHKIVSDLDPNRPRP